MTKVLKGGCWVGESGPKIITWRRIGLKAKGQVGKRGEEGENIEKEMINESSRRGGGERDRALGTGSPNLAKSIYTIVSRV